ncbi:hypothetical protein CUN91_00540 [Candidatus Carsonella ruddii]|uniref:Uncharacterized protein n=1 Tax=Carsonella ruddii TaxID=114186 RepID=A0A2K8K9A9_CARRU|nr:hypothetical protein [Candidatus Carsonella ruddii]ATX33443.1 hypothetical protein CUN91_00540 [Candidatus Carsonella ruddii]
MLKIKILLLKIYSFSNYKTNIFFFLKKIKKKFFIKINYINFIINNLNFYNKKKMSFLLYLFICEIISNLNINKNNYFLFNKKNIFLKEIKNNYSLFEILFFLFLTKIKKIFNLKKIKKIFTNVLVKIKNEVYESLKERYISTFLYIFINEQIKIKNILKLYLNYIDYNFFYFLKNIKKVCLLIFSNKEEFSKKLYIGMLKNNNNNLNYYLIFLINNLIKKNIYKISISFEIYNFDILKIIKNIKIFKKLKINIIIGIPDLFIEYIIKKKNWYLIDSNCIKKNYEYYLQSYYDEYIGYGTLREKYKNILKNKNILKISINSKKLFLNILKNKIKIIYSDKKNRNNINKHIGCLISNFYQNKIFDRNNYFNNKIYYIKNTNVIIKRNNSFYVEVKLEQNFFVCKNNIKKFFLKFKILNSKNNFLFVQREMNFHLNFRIKPIIFNINYLNKNFYNYLMFNLIKINSFYSKLYMPYIWYPGSDIYYKDYYYKNHFFSKHWKLLSNYTDNNKLLCSINLIIKIKKKFITTFDNYFLKLLVILWQIQDEKY